MPRTKRRLEGGRSTFKPQHVKNAVSGAFGKERLTSKQRGRAGESALPAAAAGVLLPASMGPESMGPARACRRCTLVLPCAEFERDRRTKDGRATCCRACQQIVRDRKFAPESRRTQSAPETPPRFCRRCSGPYRAGHHNQAFCSAVCRRAHQQEANRQRAAAFHQAHKARRQAQKKVWLAAHPDAAREMRRRSYVKHKEAERSATRAWIAANRDRYNRLMREWRRRRAAIAEGKQQFAEVGLFLLVRARTGLWRAAVPGKLVGQTERIFARHERLLGEWAVYAPGVGNSETRRVAARLQRAEQKQRRVKRYGAAA